MKNKILSSLILLSLVIILLSFSFSAADTPATTPPAATTPTTGGAASGTGETISLIAADKKQDIGKQILKDGKPEDVQVTGGKVEYKENGGGKFTATEKSIDGKTDLSDKTDFKSKGNEVARAKDGSTTEIDNKGHVTALDVKGTKPKDGKGTEVTIAGKDDTKVKLPEGAEMKKEKDSIPTGGKDTAQKSDVYTTELGDGKGSKDKVLDKPTRTQRKKEEQEGNDPYFKFNGMNYGLSDSMAEQFGLSKGSKFSGSLTMDPNGNFFTDKTTTFTDSNGKEIMRNVNLAGKYGNVNERAYLFNNADWNGEAGKTFKENGGGSYIVNDLANKHVFAGSTNEKIGPYVELGDKNPFTGYKSAIMPEGNSRIDIQGTSGAPQVKIQGDGIFYGGEGAGYLKKGDELMFKQGAKIEQIFGASNVAELGLKIDRSPSYSADVYSLKNDGSVITTSGKNLYVKSTISSSGAIGNDVFPLDNKGIPVSSPGDARVSGNNEPKGKGAKTFGEGLKNALLAGIGGKPAETPAAVPTPPVTTTPTPTPPTTQPTKPATGNSVPINKIIPGQVMINTAGTGTYGESYNQMFSQIGQPYNQNHKVVALEFSAAWCGPCKGISPTVHQFGNSRNDVKVIPIDVDANKDLASKYGITGMPTMVFVDATTGKIVDKRSGGGISLNDLNNIANNIIKNQR